MTRGGGGGVQEGSGEDGAEAEERAVVCISSRLRAGRTKLDGAFVAGATNASEQNIQLVGQGPAQSKKYQCQITEIPAHLLKIY